VVDGAALENRVGIQMDIDPISFNHTIFESVFEGEIFTNLAGKILQLNETALKLQGYESKEETAGLSVFQIVAEKDRVGVAENLKFALENGFSRNAECTLIKKDGSKYPAEMSAVTVKNASGNPSGFVIITTNITEKKCMEKELQAVEERFSKAFHSSPAAIFITKLSDECYIDVNDSFTKLTGYHRDEAVGLTSLELGIWLRPNDRSTIQDMLQKQNAIRNLEGTIVYGSTPAELNDNEEVKNIYLGVAR